MFCNHAKPNNTHTQAQQLADAICLGNLDTVEQIQAKHTSSCFADLLRSPNSMCSNAVMLAAKLGRVDILRTLLDALASGNTAAGSLIMETDDAGYTALLFAAIYGHEAVISLLFSALGSSDAIGLALQHRNDEGWTALMLAAIKGHTATFSLLLNIADYDAFAITEALGQIDTRGRTALMLAAFNGNTETVNLILQTLGDVDTDVSAAILHTDTFGFTALIYAARYNHIDTMQLLIHAYRSANNDCIAMINHPDFNGRYPIMHTLPQCNTHAMQLLLAYGATIDNCDHNIIAGLIALDSHPPIVKDLLLTIMLKDDIAWVSQTISAITDTNSEAYRVVCQYTRWAIIFGNPAFIEKVIPTFLPKLSREEYVEYLNIALHAQQFAIVDLLLDNLTVIDASGQAHQTVCSYLLHLMVVENGPLSAVGCLLRHGAIVKAYCSTSTSSLGISDCSLFNNHTQFQQAQLTDDTYALPSCELMPQANINLRVNLWNKGLSLFHVLASRGDHSALKMIMDSSIQSEAPIARRPRPGQP